MRSIHLRAVVPTDDAALVFKHVTDFARYPSVSADVRFVQTRPAAGPGEPQHTDWEVNFRRGIMRWTEREDIDPERLHVEFSQLDGDFDDFHGEWQLTPVTAGCEVLFQVTYDFGIESLAGIMDPLAERVIKRAICSVLAEVTGEVTVLEGGAALTDLGELPAASGIRIG
jgi:ribosome-associated toxin RatA of RatAB toxin-antitoxin module